MMIDQHIQDLDLSEGQSHRGLCPVCGNKNTFTAKKEMGAVVYNCYSMSCSLVSSVSFQGMTAQEVMTYLKSNNSGSTKKSSEPDTLVLPEYVVPFDTYPLLLNFMKKWGALAKEVEAYDVKDRRAVFYVRYKGRIVDAVGRALDGAEPKWLRYGKTGKPYTSYYGAANGVCVVVEDVLSAASVAHNFPQTTGIALLGTNLTEEHIEVLQNYNRVIVALDPDASLKSLQMKRSIELWTDLPTYAIALKDDIKYCHPTDLDNLRAMIGDSQ